MLGRDATSSARCSASASICATALGEVRGALATLREQLDDS
jgi:hypothetical protein